MFFAISCAILNNIRGRDVYKICRLAHLKYVLAKPLWLLYFQNNYLKICFDYLHVMLVQIFKSVGLYSGGV